MIGAAVYLIVLLSGTVLFAASARTNAAPSLTVLGSGSQLSLLIGSGSSRLLIAGGDDGSALASALAAARGPLERRIDVVVLSGKASDLAVANRVMRDFAPRHVLMVDGPLADRRSELTAGGIELLDRPLFIDLDGGITVQIEPAELGGESPSGDWWATIRHGTMVLVATSRWPDDDVRWTSAALVVITGELDTDHLHELTAAAVVLRTSAADSLELTATSGDDPPWFVRVSETEHVRLELTRAGLALPGSAQRFAPD